MSRTTLRPFRALLACEMCQLWRSPLPWLLVLAVPVLFVLVGRWQAPALERHVQLQQYLALLGTVLGTFAAWTWQRGRRSGADEILLAWPLPSWQVALVRTMALGSLTLVCWLEAALASLAYTALSYATAAQVAGVALPVAQALHDGGLILLSLAASFLGAQALGQVAGALSPGLAALVALILHRALAFAAPRVLLGTMQWPYGLLASPELQWEGSSRLVEGLCTHVYDGIFLTHQAFWAIGSLAILMALVLLWQGRREAWRPRYWAAAGLAAFVALAAALPFVALEGGYVASQQQALAAYGGPVKPTPGSGTSSPAVQEEPAAPLPRPVRYGLAVDLSRPPEVDVQATVDLLGPEAAPAETLVFTLRRAFQVDEVRLDGLPVPSERVERVGDLLRIRPAAPIAPGQRSTVALAYHGRVEDWRLDSYEMPAALASRDLIFLPAGWGWYPVPGEQRLTWEIPMTSMVFRALADRTQPFNDAEPDFAVELQAPQMITAVAGFVSDGAGRWRLQGARNQVSLLGGPWWEQQVGNVRFLVPFEELDTWQASSQDLQRLLAAAAEWTGIAPLSVVPSPLSLLNMGDNGLLDAQTFGRIYQPNLDQNRLAWGIRWWCNSLLRQQARRIGDGATAGSEESLNLQQEVSSLCAYVVSQILSDTLGQQAAQLAVQATGGSPVSPLFEAWVERTPLASQKEALRCLLRAAQVRQLTVDDLAFLQEAVKP